MGGDFVVNSGFEKALPFFVEDIRYHIIYFLGTKTNHSVRNERPFCRGFSWHILVFTDIVN